MENKMDNDHTKNNFKWPPTVLKLKKPGMTWICQILEISFGTVIIL